MLATSAFAALQHAIAAAREDAGLYGPFRLNAPATVDAIVCVWRHAADYLRL